MLKPGELLPLMISFPLITTTIDSPFLKYVLEGNISISIGTISPFLIFNSCSCLCQGCAMVDLSLSSSRCDTLNQPVATCPFSIWLKSGNELLHPVY